MQTDMRYLTILLFALFIAVLVLLQQNTAPLYSGEVRVVEDAGSALDLASALQIDWQKQASSPVNLGYSQSAFWFYLPLTPVVTTLGSALLMEIDFPTIDELDLFHVGPDGQVKRHVKTGTDLPFASRPMWDDDWVMPLENVQPGDRVLVRARTSNSLQMPIRLYQYDDFFRQDNVALLFWGCYYGLMLVMALYSALNSLVIRDPLYLYYGAYVLASSLASASLNGHAFAYLWPAAPEVNSYTLTVFTCLIICFGTAFALVYLDFVSSRSKARFVGYGFIGLALATVVASLLYDVDLSYWAAVQVVAFTMALFVFGVLAVLRHHYLGWYFLAGWSAFLVGTGMFGLNVLGVLPFTVITVHSKEVGSAFEILMLALGMSAIYHHEREERSRINSAIDVMKQRLQHRASFINNKSGFMQIPRLENHLQDIRGLDRRIHQEMGRLLVVSVIVIDKATRRPDYIAQGDCLRALFNSRITVFPFKAQREGLSGEVTVLLFPLHNKFEAESIIERVEQWNQSLGEQYDLHFGYAISHLTEKYEVDYIEESLHYLEEAVLQSAMSYSIDDTLSFAGRQSAAAGSGI